MQPRDLAQLVGQRQRAPAGERQREGDSSEGEGSERWKCIVEGERPARPAMRAESDRCGTGRYTDSIVGQALDRRSPSRDADRRERSASGSMTLRIYNTLTRATEDFTPLEPGHVRMYVCGITVYDLCHIGHARFMMAFDVVQRWLKAQRLPRHLRAQHHRHRRQDHQARARARHADPRS